jgi:hypothetical protein
MLGDIIMEAHPLRIGVVALVVVGLQTVTLAAGWNRSVIVTTLGENNVGGEVVQFTVGEVVDNPGHCPDATGYAIRDPATLKGSLAQLSSAMVTGRHIDIFVTGTCDATGMPNVVGVILR